MEWRRSLVADLQLAGEGGLLDDAEDEAEHVVEQSGDDAAVGATGCALMGGAERHHRLDLVADAVDLEVDPPRAGGAGERTVVVGLDRGAASGGLGLTVTDVLDRAVTRVASRRAVPSARRAWWRRR